MQENIPKSVKDLSAKNENIINFKKEIKGHKFDKNYTLSEFIDIFSSVGFQATNLSLAIDQINSMIDNDDKIIVNSEECDKSSILIKKAKTKIFFGCTSNMITSGLRDTVCYLAKNRKIDVFVTTAGGIEEDLIKCMGDTYLASFDADGHVLRKNGYNRVGNLVIPNENYVKFEIWLTTLLDKLIAKSENGGPIILTPSKLIKIFGKEIDDRNSILYWCFKNDIPVYCPALTDGSIGDILTFYGKRDLLKLDIVEDIYNMNYEAIHQKKTGVIILGSGLIKHHILNANLFKNGADYCVLINNASEFDGSDAGASVNEAVSWGKLKGNGVKVFGDASILFPLIVAATFAKNQNK